MNKTLLLSACALSLMTSQAFATEKDLPSREEMWKMIQVQQEQIQTLQSAIQTQGQKITQAEAKVEETQEQVEKTAEAVKETNETMASIEPAAGGAPNGWWNKTSIGGYGELHYNGGAKDEVDLHRFVVNVNHEFNEDIRFASEIEIEHALSGDGKNGEVEIEQAYIEFDLTEDDAHRAKAGVFLLPVGITNETHEPTTFFGVERNPVEKNVIPTTWWEGGASLSGQFGAGFSYDVAVHSGLQTPTTGSNAYKVRNGRQKVSEAEATDLAYTGRLKWTGYPGVELGITGQYQEDISQNSGDDEEVGATLIEAHADLRRGGWGLRALYAEWNLDGTAPEAIGRDEQYGWYVEPSYRFDVPFGYDGEGALGVFARYNEWDNNAGVSNSTTEFEQTDIGFNYWPIENVVLKADMAFIDGPTDPEDDEILNLGVGWAF